MIVDHDPGDEHVDPPVRVRRIGWIDALVAKHMPPPPMSREDAERALAPLW